MSAQLDRGLDPYYGSLQGDYSDAQHMAPFVHPIVAASGSSWWEGTIAYGLTRAIDNRFAPPPVQGNTSPGSFAGQNGRTYVNGQQGPLQQGVMGLPMIALLAGGAVLAYLALKS